MRDAAASERESPVTPLPIFDGHNDTLAALYRRGLSFFEEHAQGHLDLPRAQRGGLIGGIYAIFPPAPPDSPESDPLYGLQMTEEGYALAPNSPVEPGYARAFTDAVLKLLDTWEQAPGEPVRVVRTYEDLHANRDAGRHSLVLHFEDAAAIEADLSNLEAYYQRGLRSLGLVWSRPNAFGCGVPFRYPHSPDTGPGLTPAGKQLVRACNRLGIQIDLAHLNERGFWDAAALTTAPLVVSHAGVHALCASTRNLTDAQIDSVGQSNGVIGVIFEPGNLRRDGRPGVATPLMGIVEHIDYIAQHIGVEHVAFGSDFDGADMPQDLPDVASLPRLIAALHDRGFDQTALEKIAYRNWFRVLQAAWRSS
ncbi:MAG: dipeptidase [Anaerolineae bacterium]|nr:dipeptidase [Anaerolineae bacterium]